MPITEINIAQGRSREFIRQIMDTIHIALVEKLGIPEDDKNIRLKEFDPLFFDAKPPYQFFIEISMFTGRTKETKRQLFSTIVHKLKEELEVDPKTVFIMINEQPLENWGIRGGIPADEIQIGFEIKK